MRRRVSARRIKANRPYTYEEAADVSGVTARTVRSWRKAGLNVMTDQRPHLVLGEDLQQFISERLKPRIPLPPELFKCMTCKRRVRPLDDLAFYTPITPLRGQLVAFCEHCEGQCSKFAGERALKDLAQFFEIARSNPKQA